MSFDIVKSVRRFLLDEQFEKQTTSMKDHITAIKDLIGNMRPASERDKSRIVTINEHLSKINSAYNKLLEELEQNKNQIDELNKKISNLKDKIRNINTSTKTEQ